MLVVGIVALLVSVVDVGMDAGVELEELEVAANGFAGGLGREGLGADGGCGVGSTEGNEVGVVGVLSTDVTALGILGNTRLSVVVYAGT